MRRTYMVIIPSPSIYLMGVYTRCKRENVQGEGANLRRMAEARAFLEGSGKRSKAPL